MFFFSFPGLVLTLLDLSLSLSLSRLTFGAKSNENNTGGQDVLRLPRDRYTTREHGID
jgi:hypothetical protein